MKTFQKTEIGSLAKEIRNLNKRIIVIDGEDGVGKSTFVAPIIAKRCNGTIIHLDSYLIKKQDVYKLKLDKLLYDIERLKKQKRLMVIEGIMTLKVLKDIGIIPDLHIYVESPTANTMWNEEYGIYLQRGLEEIFEYEEKQMQLITPNSKLTPFRKQVIEYHYAYRPFEKADYKLLIN